MKTRLFAVILAVFAFCSVASAQAYFIRVESRNNLRSCAGFDCRVVETAPVGTVLEVVGEYNRWLKINRNGEEVWMANWIDYSRVDPSQSKHPGVIIEGSAGFTAQMEAALDVLKDRTPHWYDYVDIGLNKIVQILQKDHRGVDVVARTFYLDYGDDPPVRSTAERHTIVTAGTLVHDACHVHRIQDAGFPYGTNAEKIREERACVEVQLEALEAMDIYNEALGTRQWYQEIIENIENPEYWWWADDDESRIETDEQTSPPASVDPSQSKHPGVAIEGSAGFIAQMEAALDMLKDRTPQWYDYVDIGLNKIVQTESNLGVDVGARTFYLTYSDDPPAGYTAEQHTIVTASEFVHEACHVHRYEAGINEEAYIEEGACVEVQLEALEAMDIYNKALATRQWYQEIIENIENPEYWWWGCGECYGYPPP